MAVRHITQNEFDEVINSGKTVLVDFFATWCGPCKMLGPVLEEISETLPEGQEIVKIDIDQNMAVARRYRVMSVPTMKVFKNGLDMGTLIGYNEKQDILDFMAKAK